MSVAYLRYEGLIFVVDNAAPLDIAEYYYEEKLCPHDVLGGLQKVVSIEDMNPDEHGLFEYLGQSAVYDADYARTLTEK